MKRLSTTVTAMLMACQSVIGFESVYDIIERQNQRRYFRDPVSGYPEAREILDRYPIFGRKPDSIHPAVPFHRFGYYGNGYDNIGNGNVRVRDRLHFFPEEASYYRRYRAGFDHGHRREFPIFRENYQYMRPYFGERDFDQDEIKVGRLYQKKGNSDFYKQHSFIASNEGNDQRNLLENFRNNKISTLSDARRKENFGETSHSDRINENKSTVRNNRISKKGHVTKGFSSHHHKDETGNSTTFYDEFSDHGGQNDYKDVADGFGTKTTSEHFSNIEDGKFFSENGGQSANYGTGSVADSRKTEKNYIINDTRLDRDERFRLEDGKDHLGNQMNLYDGGYDPEHLRLSHYNYY